MDAEIKVANTINMLTYPQMLGYWSHADGYVKIFLPKRPNWFVRFWCRVCFDLTWVDLPEDPNVL